MVAALEGFLAGAHEENSSLKNQLSEGETHLFMAKEEKRVLEIELDYARKIVEKMIKELADVRSGSQA